MTRLNKEFLENIEEMNQEYKKNDEMREEIIKKSREILKLSKKAIYATHRGELDEAQQLLTTAKQKSQEANTFIEQVAFGTTGALKASLEEYVEAQLFYTYKTEKRIILKQELEEGFSIENQSYLGGLSDFTGELVRQAVLLATKKKHKEVKEIFELIEEIYGALMNFDFRTGDLRKKFDSIKYNLAKLETINYELSLRE